VDYDGQDEDTLPVLFSFDAVSIKDPFHAAASLTRAPLQNGKMRWAQALGGVHQDNILVGTSSPVINSDQDGT
jgi:hypothetical protein